MIRTKAYRRFQERKRKNKTKDVLWLWRIDFQKPFPLEDREIGRLANCHCNPCSCFMCGNARKIFGELTLQEQKNNIDFQEALNEYRKAC